MNSEIWKPVLGFVGHYEVSNLGRVRSLDYYIHHRIANRTRKGTILKPRPARHGYLRVALYHRAERADRSIHYLVALAFLPSTPGLLEVNHINGIKTDNRPENLEWCDRIGNMTHARKTGLWKRPLSNETVAEIRAAETSHAEEARRHNIGESTIRRIRSGKIYRST